MKMTKYILGIVILWSMTLSTKAQQDPQYTLHMLNGISIHPAYAGSLGGLSANVLYRNQWTGWDAAPKTFAANVQMRYFKDQLGSGISVFNDQIGVFSRSSVSLAQAYHLRLSKLTVSFGLSGSLEQFQAKLTDVNPSVASGSDNTFSSNIAKANINVGAGTYIYSDKFWFGFSAPHLLKSKWFDKGMYGDADPKPYGVTHMFISGGGILDMGALQLKPSLMVKKSVNAPFQYELGCSVYAMRKVGLGAYYRFQDALMFTGEFQINEMFRLAYAYDLTTSAISTYSSGSHEILLRYTMGRGTQSTQSPRLF
jgi:type IX secretion system PorP/SprF family membrane protein